MPSPEKELAPAWNSTTLQDRTFWPSPYDSKPNAGFGDDKLFSKYVLPKKSKLIENISNGNYDSASKKNYMT